MKNEWIKHTIHFLRINLWVYQENLSCIISSILGIQKCTLRPIFGFNRKIYSHQIQKLVSYFKARRASLAKIGHIFLSKNKHELNPFIYFALDQHKDGCGPGWSEAQKKHGTSTKPWFMGRIFFGKKIRQDTTKLNKARQIQ